MKAKKHLSLNLRIPLWWPDGSGWRRVARALVPNPGTLIILALFLLTQSAGALPLKIPATTGSSTTTISYQGRLADSAGNPITSPGIGMQFCLYDTDVGGSPVEGWCENHPSVPVEDGLFSMLLGSINPIPISTLASHSSLWLGITVGSDSEMNPRELLTSVPYALYARSADVADGAIATSKLADQAVTTEKLAEGSVDGTRIAHAFGASSKPLANLVMRSGITAWDWSDPAHTGGWMDFDTSSIVPPGTRAVLIRVHAVGQNDAEFGFRKNGLSGPTSTWDPASAVYGYMPLTGGDHAVYQHYIVELDSNRIFEHNHDGKWSRFDWVIQGWWEPANR